MERRGRLHLARGISVASVALALVVVSATVAWASFSSAPTASGTYATGTLSAPTNLVASQGPCTVAVSASVTLTWTATTSTWADGYEILRSLISGGPYTTVATVSGQATTTYTDSTPLFSTLYYYVVRATKAAWRSANSNSASRTTLSALCT